jgi:hypothetical protein
MRHGSTFRLRGRIRWVADVSTVTLLVEIIERNKSAFDVNVEPSPVTAPIPNPATSS